jgi:hypothetical protein
MSPLTNDGECNNNKTLLQEHIRIIIIRQKLWVTQVAVGGEVVQVDTQRAIALTVQIVDSRVDLGEIRANGKMTQGANIHMEKMVCALQTLA